MSQLAADALDRRKEALREALLLTALQHFPGLDRIAREKFAVHFEIEVDDTVGQWLDRERIDRAGDDFDYTPRVTRPLPPAAPASESPAALGAASIPADGVSATAAVHTGLPVAGLSSDLESAA